MKDKGSSPTLENLAENIIEVIDQREDSQQTLIEAKFAVMRILYPIVMGLPESNEWEIFNAKE